MREWLPRLAVDRPVTVLMAFLALLVIGLIAWARIPLQMMPDGFEPGFLWVRVPYRNASPLETDEKIVRVVQAQLATVPGIQSLRSFADSGSAGFGISFHSSVDMDEAYNAVVDRLERAMPELPDDVDRYWIFRFDPNDEPVVWAGVQLPEEVEDPWHVMTRVVQPRLERIPGVASLDVWGVPQRGVWIEYDKERTYAAGVDLGGVQQRLASDNFQVSGGQIFDRGQVRHIRSLSRLDLDEIRRFPVKEGVVLADIADITYAAAHSSSINRVNGAKAAALAVRKESSANAVEVSQAITQALKELEGDPRVQGARFFVFFSQGELIKESIDNLADSALTGGLFAIAILYLFLREWRMTLLISTSIPFSMLITIGVLYFRGDSLNLLSLMGLMLAVGMVVDNAIVVVETIYRRRAEGAGAREAAIRGTGEVNLAIIASTATTMVVFLPVILMSENAAFSFFMSVIGLPVVFALAASLVVALIFAPLATRYMGQASIKPDPRWLGAFSRVYERLLRWMLTHRLDAGMMLFAGLFLTFVVALPGVKCTAGMDQNLNDFTVRITVPPQASLSERDAILKRFEDTLEAHREAWGIRVYRTRLEGDSNRGQLYVYLESDGPLPRDEVMARAREELPQDLPGVTATIGWDVNDQGGAGSNQIRLTLYGEDVGTLTALAEEVARRVRSVPGVMQAHADALNEGADEIRLIVDRDAVTRHGVSAAQVGQLISYAMRGSTLTPLRVDDKEIAVTSRFTLEDRSDLNTLLDFDVWSPATGSLVPVRALTHVEVAKGPSQIRREEGRTSTGITLDLEAEATTNAVFAGIDAALSDMAFPRGYSWSKGQRFNQQQENDEAMGLALLLSVCFIFLLMGVLFESFVLPLSILTTIPMALFGALWLLFLTGTPMDTMGGVGIVILVGVVVNNGIVLIDLVTQLRAEGMERTEALVEAGRRRLRPILMTAMTTICGLIPMAVGSSAFIGIPYAPLGRTVIGGLLAATFLTLVFVPVLYTVLDDLREGGLHWFAWVRGSHA